MKKGFTLIETLIALAMASVIISISYSALNQNSNLVTKLLGRSDVRADIRSAVSVITKDIQNSTSVSKNSSGYLQFTVAEQNNSAVTHIIYYHFLSNSIMRNVDGVDSSFLTNVTAPFNITSSDYINFTVSITTSNKINSLGTKENNTETFNVSRKLGATVDTVPPVITLTGSNSLTIFQGSSYSDSGATAIDNVDGDISSKITVTNNVNSAVAGSYTVNYDIKDTAGNAATTVTRTVTVTAGTPHSDILSFSLPEQTGAAIINATDHSIVIPVPASSSSLSYTKPSFTISPGATAKIGSTIQTSGVSGINLYNSQSVTYTITASDGSTTTWFVGVARGSKGLVWNVTNATTRTAMPFSSSLSGTKLIITSAVGTQTFSSYSISASSDIIVESGVKLQCNSNYSSPFNISTSGSLILQPGSTLSLNASSSYTTSINISCSVNLIMHNATISNNSTAIGSYTTITTSGYMDITGSSIRSQCTTILTSNGDILGDNSILTTSQPYSYVYAICNGYFYMNNASSSPYVYTNYRGRFRGYIGTPAAGSGLFRNPN